MKKIWMYVACGLAFIPRGEAQPGDTLPPWTFNISLGYYMSDDAAARYYNGEDNSRLQSMLSPNTGSGFHNSVYEQVRQSLGGYDFTIAEYAQDMAYLNSLSFELGATRNLRNNWNVSARFYNVRLSASGVFTLDVQRPNTGNEPGDFNLEQGSISGTETRSHIVLALGKRIPLGGYFYLPVEAGFNMNFTEVKKNEFNIAGNTYSLPLYSDYRNLQAQPGATFGSGFTVSAGIRYQLPGSFGFEAKAAYFRTRVNVNNVVKGSSSVFVPSVGFTKSF